VIFLFRILHQKAKTSDVNTLTPRQHEQYSPASEQNNYAQEHSPKYPSK
jgi:hypothetical protein